MLTRRVIDPPVDALLEQLDSESEETRLRALEGLKNHARQGNIGAQQARRWLISLAMFRNKFEETRGQSCEKEYHMTLQYLGHTRQSEIYQFLREFIRQQPSPILRVSELNAAADSLANTGEPNAYEDLQWYMGTYTALSDSASSLWRMVANLGKVGISSNVEEVCTYLQHADKSIRIAAAEALEHMGTVSSGPTAPDREPFDTLTAKLTDEVDSQVVSAYLRAVGATPDARSLPFLLRQVETLTVAARQKQSPLGIETRDSVTELRAAVEAVGYATSSDTLSKMPDRPQIADLDRACELLGPLASEGGRLGVEATASLSEIRRPKAKPFLELALQMPPNSNSHHAARRQPFELGPERITDWAAVGLARLNDSSSSAELVRAITVRSNTPLAAAAAAAAADEKGGASKGPALGGQGDIFRNTGYIAYALAEYKAKEAIFPLAVGLLRMHLRPWTSDETKADPPAFLIEQYAAALEKLRRSNSYTRAVLKDVGSQDSKEPAAGKSRRALVFTNHLSIIRDPPSEQDLDLVLSCFGHAAVRADMTKQHYADFLTTILRHANEPSDAHRKLLLQFFRNKFTLDDIPVAVREEAIEAVRQVAVTLAAEWSGLSIPQKKAVLTRLNEALPHCAVAARAVLESMGLQQVPDADDVRRLKKDVDRALKLLDSGKTEFSSSESDCVML